MKLQYIKPSLTMVKLEMQECLLNESFELSLPGSSEPPVNGFTGGGMSEKFVNPIWGDDASADEGDILSPW
jgi:hypothetical protein